jgi:CubicO group peptidase (beta-lactamase class C family)
MKILLIAALVLLGSANIIDDTDIALTKLRNDRFLKGIQLQITKGKQIVYNFNIGEKNSDNERIDNSTVAKIASLSKSFASVALMQLVDSGKVSLNKTLS